MTAALSDAERIALRAALDRLVPPVDDLPGAGTMGLLEPAERMAARHPPFARALARLAATLVAGDFAVLPPAAQDAALAACEAAEPAVFGTVVDLVYLAYYGDARVHARIGWRGGALQPRGFTLPPFDEAILEQARQRPPFWRQTPG